MKQLMNIMQLSKKSLFRLCVLFLGVYFFLFPLGQLVRVPTFSVSLPLYLTDIVVGMTSLFGVLLSVLSPRERFPGFFPGVMFFLIAASSLFLSLSVFSFSQVLVGGLYLLRFLSYALLYPTVFLLLKHKGIKEKTFLLFLLFSGIGFFVSVMLQMYYVSDFRPLAQFGWDPHVGRVLGSFFDPNFAGGFLVILLLFFLYLYGEEKAKGTKLALLILMCGMYVAWVFTLSRSSYVMFLVSFFVMGVLRSWKIFFIALLAFFLALQMFPRTSERVSGAVQIDITAEARVTSWQQGLAFWQEKPFTGWGFNTLRYVQKRYGFQEQAISHAGAGIDSGIVFVLATTGVFGLVFYLLAGFELVKFLIQQKKKLISVVVVAMFVGLSAHGQFVNSLFYPWMLGWLFPLMGFAYYKGLQP